MSFTAALAKVPWKDILKYSPIIVETASKIYDTVRDYISPEEAKSRSRKTVSLGDLARRVQKLEVNELAQAELVQDIAKQLNDIALASNVTDNRSRITLASALTAFVFSILSLVLVLTK